MESTPAHTDAVHNWGYARQLCRDPGDIESVAYCGLLDCEQVDKAWGINTFHRDKKDGMESGYGKR